MESLEPVLRVTHHFSFALLHLIDQNDRRVSGPPVLAAGGPGAIATLRKAAMQRTLEVGDESDVEPPGPAACAPVGDGASQGPPPGAYNRITPAQRAGAALRQQNAQQILQSTLNAAARLGRRDSSSSSILPSAPPGHAAGQPGAAVLGNASTEHSVGGVSPRHRSVSAETYLPSTHGVGVTTAAHTPNVAGRITGPGPGTMGPAHGHPPLPPQHPSTHLEPLNTAPIRATTGRFSTGPSDPGMVSVDRPCTGSLVSVDSQPPRSASFSSFAASPPPAGVQDCHDPLSTHPPNHAFPGAAPMTLAVAAPPASQPAAGSTSPTALATSHCGLTGPPMLPGLYANGRRVGSFRNEGLGLSGWDTEPPVVTHQSAAQAATNITLWVGPAGAGALQHTMVLGTSALGRVSPLSIAPTQTRRDTSSRIIRAPGCTSMGLLDLSIGPDRSNDKAGQGLAPTGSRAGRTPSSLGMVPGRSLSPDVGTRGSMTGYSAPQQDALTEFCANRAELGSAGIGAGNISGAAPSDVRVVVNPNSVLVGAPIAMPMRVTSLSKATAVGRVS